MSGAPRGPERERGDGARGQPPLSPRSLLLARLALLWEMLWPALWPPVGVLGLFVAAALSGLFEDMPVWLHATLLAGFAAALIWTLYRFAHALALPSAAAAERRIERDSGLAHRPLAALGDELAVGSGDAFAEALWRAHLARMRAALGRIRIAWPSPGLAQRDPRALRFGLVLLLVLGAIDAGADAPARILDALDPGLGPLSARSSAMVELWLTPPAYTGVAPIFLRAGPGVEQAANASTTGDRGVAEPNARVDVPIGSKILARFSGGAGEPTMTVGGRVLDFKPVDATTYRLEGTLTEGDRIAVRQGGREIARWRVRVIPDLAPTIAFAAAPAATLRQALRLEYMAADDYGLARVEAVIRRQGAPASEAPLVIQLPLPAGHPRHAHEIGFQDLTPHPWAGLPVTITLRAADEPGQIGSSGPYNFTLPERVFTNPVARAIVDQRKELIKDPATRLDVADALGAIAAHPELFSNDIDVFLALSTARSALRLSDAADSIASVETLMWDTALALEDGHLSVAERDLRDIQRRLADALDHNAPDKEIQDLIAKYADAVQSYLQELARQDLQNQGPNQTQSQNQAPIDRNARMLQNQDIGRLIEQMREMAQSGLRDAARQLLSQLQDMLENLRMARVAPQNAPNQRFGASNLMRGMDALIGKQDRLLQQTFRAAQRDSSAPAQPGGPGAAAADQEALRRALGEIMRRVGDMAGNIPDKLGEAERAMRDATTALDQDALQDAVGAQTRALESLRRGRDAMREALKKQLGQEGDPTDLDAFGPSRDPTGRLSPGFGNFDANDVKIPEHGTIQRTRRILDELERRAGERERPEIELDYIDRLLKRY